LIIFGISLDVTLNVFGYKSIGKRNAPLPVTDLLISIICPLLREHTNIRPPCRCAAPLMNEKSIFQGRKYKFRVPPLLDTK